MTYKQIEQAHEVRMWLGQVVIPAMLIAGTILANPQNRHAIKNTCDKTMDSIKSKFQKN